MSTNTELEGLAEYLRKNAYLQYGDGMAMNFHRWAAAVERILSSEPVGQVVTRDGQAHAVLILDLPNGTYLYAAPAPLPTVREHADMIRRNPAVAVALESFRQEPSSAKAISLVAAVIAAALAADEEAAAIRSMGVPADATEVKT